MSKSPKNDYQKFGGLLLETEAYKKGMSFIMNWTQRYLRLFDSDNGLVLAYYKTPDSPKAKGYLRIKPHGKVHEIDHLGKHKNKRENVLTIAALDGRTFTCSMPDPDTRTQWAEMIREECDNASDKGRRLSQTTKQMTKGKIACLTIKIVSHMRYKKAANTKISRKGSVRAMMKEIPYGFDFGAFNFQTGKWYKLWSKTLTDKGWQQMHETIRKSGLLNIFGSSSVALKFPESYGRKSDSLEKKRSDRALDIELLLHSLFNLVDINAIRANAAPWVCAIAFPQLHRALDMPGIVASKLCQLGYRRKCLAFGEDPTYEHSGVDDDFDMDHDVDDFALSPQKPDAPERSEVTNGVAGIRKKRSFKSESGPVVKSKLTYKPVVVYSGVLWKKPTSGGFGRGRKRWFSLRRSEGGRTAELEYFEDPDEKRLKGNMVINDSCYLDLGTAYCLSGRWRFCVKSGAKQQIEAEAGSEKEFGTWAMHILRYTYTQNRLSCVTPRGPFESPGSQLAPSAVGKTAAAAAPSTSAASALPPAPHLKAPEESSDSLEAAAASPHGDASR